MTRPPDPTGVSTAAEFVDRMAELRLWAGKPSLRALHRLGGTVVSPAGDRVDALPPTTVSGVLNGKGLPRPPRMALVEAYVTACLTAGDCEPGRIRPLLRKWREAWQAVAADAEPDAPPRPVLARHQLPMDIPEFTGREYELDYLHTIAEAATGVPRIVTVVGMAGAGKTRLAVHCAHGLAGNEYADIQLWADLRGFHPDQPPASPESILENFLLLLGVTHQQLPASLDARAALYRDRLAGKRALIVLDDAAGEDQVRPLLPGAPGCLVLITSRRSLTGLDGADVLRLGSFRTDEALEVLEHHAGSHRVRAETEAALRLCECCGNLPLAVAVTGRYLRTRPVLTLSALLDRLLDDEHAGDFPARSKPVQAVFDVSYQALPAGHQRMLRLLAIHPGVTFTVPPVAALAGVSPPDAQQMLDDLFDEHLLSQRAEDSYGMHDLVRDYAALKAHEVDPRAHLDAALERLTRHYLDHARHATVLIHPREFRRVAVPSGPAPWTTGAEAVAWVKAEYENISAVIRRVVGEPGAGQRLAIDLVLALYRPMINRGHSSDRVALHELAANAAHRTGNRRREAQLWEDAGNLCCQAGRFADAVDYSERALSIWTELGEQIGRRGCLGDLGNCYRQQGRYAEAVDRLNEALAICRETGDSQGEASVHNFLGQTYASAGDIGQAKEHLSLSVRIYQDVGNRLGVAIAKANVGWVLQRSGDAAAAVPCHQESLVVFHELYDHYNEAEQHWALGQARHHLGDPVSARYHWHIAIRMLHEQTALDDAERDALLAAEVPPTPELIRLNT